jgi:hypothetical protein
MRLNDVGPKEARSKTQFWRIVAGLVIFGIAFGYVEAAVVAYLRAIYNPLRLHFYPGTADELFPLLSFEQLRLLGPEHIMRLKTEIGRELATLLMLAGVAVTAARSVREWVAAFLVCFGIWDITFYVSLKLLLHWPASLMTWDILFLIPVPWTGPVIAPLVASVSMIASGVVLLWREYDGKPVHLSAVRWALILLGGALIVAAFMWDFRNTASGGNPNPFNWVLFISGEVIGVLAFASGFRPRKLY